MKKTLKIGKNTIGYSEVPEYSDCYIIQSPHGVTCCGFDHCLKEMDNYRKFLNMPAVSEKEKAAKRGKLETYQEYLELQKKAVEHTVTRKYTLNLHPKLLHKEGRIVTFNNKSGDTFTGRVERSTGPLQTHILIEEPGSPSGFAINPSDNINNLRVF